MSIDAARSVIAEVWRAWSASDLVGLSGLLADDCEWESPAVFGLPERMARGRDAVLALVDEIHQQGKIQCRLLDAVEGSRGIAAVSEVQATTREGTSGVGPSFDRFLLQDERVLLRKPYRARSSVLRSAGIKGQERRDALIVRDWDDPRVFAHGPDDVLVGRRMSYRRYLGDDHVHCAVSWRKIWNLEDPNGHRAGYVALDPETDEPTSNWISEESFDECWQLFGWEVVATPPEAA